MPKITGATIVKLIIACFLVGLVLVWLNLQPKDLLIQGWHWVKALAEWAVENLGSAMSYILLGAVVVLPVWLVFYLLRALRGRK
jgi:hypothetical protein